MALRSWLTTTRERHYPATEPAAYRQIGLEGALNEQLSFQACVWMDDPDTQTVALTAEGPRNWNLRVRRVGYVPVRHLNTALAQAPGDIEGERFIPGYVPDPLFEESQVVLAPRETDAFWITVTPDSHAAPGQYPITVTAWPERGRKRIMQANIALHGVTLQPRRNFTMTHWFYADAISDWYAVTPFSASFWPLCQAYMRNYADHGLDMIYVPIFTPPLDGVKKPTQLLRVTKTDTHTYAFDWSDVERWIQLARACGITHFEWTHPFTQWGVKYAIRIYEGQGHDETLLWPPETPATSETYRNFLSRLLPELKAFLDKHDLLENSAFHVSDEPHSQADKAHYVAARNLLKELAPWMKTMDALTDVEYGRKGLTDMPIPSIRTALQFHQEGIESWCYYCCGPRGKFLNRLLDTPLAKIAMHGFLFYRWPFKGFLHWGFNYWYRSQTRTMIDPFSVQDGHAWPGWAYGDTFQVYPGPKGPLDSIRWEVFSESLQDYRLLQTLELPRNHKLLSGIRSFENFPKTERWRRQTRNALFDMAD